MKAESAPRIKSSVPGTFSNRIWEVIFVSPLINGRNVSVYFQHFNMEGVFIERACVKNGETVHIA